MEEAEESEESDDDEDYGNISLSIESKDVEPAVVAMEVERKVPQPQIPEWIEKNLGQKRLYTGTGEDMLKDRVFIRNMLKEVEFSRYYSSNQFINHFFPVS